MSWFTKLLNALGLGSKQNKPQETAKPVPPSPPAEQVNKPVENAPQKPAEKEAEKPIVLVPPPWLAEAKKYNGKNEADPAFNKFMSSKWSLFGMNLGTIKENWAAWCGLAAAVALVSVGMPYQKDGSLAKNWDKYGIAVEWKTNGIPQGALVRINHNGDCNSSSGNHITMANGSCAPADIVEMKKDANGVYQPTGKIKSGATFDGYGGNQGNTWKNSTYPVADICAVRWPKEYQAPPKVLVSKNCSSKHADNESTR